MHVQTRPLLTAVPRTSVPMVSSIGCDRINGKFAAERGPDGVKREPPKSPARPGGQNVPSILTSPRDRKELWRRPPGAAAKSASAITHFPLSFHRFAVSRWRA